MNIIQQINKEFDERFVTMTMSERAIFEDPDKVKQFLNDAIRRVLERTVTDTCEGQPIEIDIGMVGDFLKELDELNK